MAKLNLAASDICEQMNEKMIDKQHTGEVKDKLFDNFHVDIAATLTNRCGN